MKKISFILFSLLSLWGCSTASPETPVVKEDPVLNMQNWTYFDMRKFEIPLVQVEIDENRSPFLVPMPKGTDSRSQGDLRFTGSGFAYQDFTSGKTDLYASVSIYKSENFGMYAECINAESNSAEKFSVVGKSGKNYEVSKMPNPCLGSYLYTFNFEDGVAIASYPKYLKGRLGERIVDQAIRNMVVLDE